MLRLLQILLSMGMDVSHALPRCFQEMDKQVVTQRLCSGSCAIVAVVEHPGVAGVATVWA